MSDQLIFECHGRTNFEGVNGGLKDKEDGFLNGQGATPRLRSFAPRLHDGQPWAFASTTSILGRINIILLGERMVSCSCFRAISVALAWAPIPGPSGIAEHGWVDWWAISKYAPNTPKQHAY